MMKARDRKTGTEFAVTVIDDYFGRHAYGYRIHERDGDVLTEQQFYRDYEEVPTKAESQEVDNGK